MTSSNITPEDLLLGYANPAYVSRYSKICGRKEEDSRI